MLNFLSRSNKSNKYTSNKLVVKSMIPGLKSFESIVFLLAIILWILTEYIGAAIIPYLRRHGTKIKKDDRGSRLLLSVSMYISVIIAFYVTFHDIGTLPNWTFYMGIFIMILGIFIRQWSIGVLGVFFSVEVGTQKDQQSCAKGPIQTGKTSILYRITFNFNRHRVSITILDSCYYNGFRILSNLWISYSYRGEIINF